MKKTILATAMASLFTAAAAQGAQIYSQDNVSVDLFGDAEIVVINSLDENEHEEISIDEANMGFQLDYAVNEDVTLSGLVEFGIATGTATLTNAWAGVGSATYGTLTVGKQTTLYDDSGIGADYQFGFTSFYEQDNSGEQVIKYKIDKEDFYAGVAYLVSSEAGQTDGIEGFDANIGVRAGDFEATVYYADMTEKTSDLDVSNVNVELRYQLDALALAAAYAHTDRDEANSNTDTFGITAAYQITEQSTVAAGWANIDAEANPDLENQFYVNTSYAFTDYVAVYAEVGANDSDDSEVGYAVGMTVEF